MALPLMRKATAVWLVENTSLTFLQIANFSLPSAGFERYIPNKWL